MFFVAGETWNTRRISSSRPNTDQFLGAASVDARDFWSACIGSLGSGRLPDGAPNDLEGGRGASRVGPVQHCEVRPTDIGECDEEVSSDESPRSI